MKISIPISALRDPGDSQETIIGYEEALFAMVQSVALPCLLKTGSWNCFHRTGT